MRQLLTQGADPNARDEATQSALATACLGNTSEAVRLLLEAGADADGTISLEDHRTGHIITDVPLMIAAGRDDRKVHSLTSCLMSAW